MKLFLYLVFILIVISCSLGFYLKSISDTIGDKLIGIGIFGLFFLWMPCFIYHRWKSRSFSDYMLTEESIDKMNHFKKTK